MSPKELYSKLRSGETVYVFDDFKEAAIRLFVDSGKTMAYIKYRGRKEIKIPQSNETVCEIILGGEEISKSEYDRY